MLPWLWSPLYPGRHAHTTVVDLRHTLHVSPTANHNGCGTACVAALRQNARGLEPESEVDRARGWPASRTKGKLERWWLLLFLLGEKYDYKNVTGKMCRCIAVGPHGPDVHHLNSAAITPAAKCSSDWKLASLKLQPWDARLEAGDGVGWGGDDAEITLERDRGFEGLGWVSEIHDEFWKLETHEPKAYSGDGVG